MNPSVGVLKPLTLRIEYNCQNMLKSAFKIGTRMIGKGEPCFIIAEISANHNQDFETAARMVKIFANAGADAIKLQTYTPDDLTIDCDKGSFKIPKGNQFAGPKTLYELYQGSHMPWEFQPRLKKLADKLGVFLFSTPLSPKGVDFLEHEVHVGAYKNASFEITYADLLKSMAKSGKPVVISNGGASIREIAEAVEILEQNGCSQLLILQCSSGYPSLPKQVHLANIKAMSEMFGVPIGLSDHTEGIGVSVAAVALGACAIEKHVTLNKKDQGPDHRFSMEPDEFRLMVKSIREAEAAARGGVSFEVAAGPATENKAQFSRSVYIVKDIRKGDKLTRDNVRVIRPGDGLHPREFEYVLGMKVNRSVPRGTPMSWDLVKT